VKSNALAAFLLVFLGCSPSAQPLDITDFPKPPQQRSQWSAPGETNELVSATTTLFNQGLADPRGCDYREVELETGDIWSGSAHTQNTCLGFAVEFQQQHVCSLLEWIGLADLFGWRSSERGQ
jgi:hypothetical protein